jgi:UMF1 family MFS transporter
VSTNDAPTGERADAAPLETIDGTTLTPREQRRQAFAWQLYDVGNSAFQAIVVTFVFAT